MTREMAQKARPERVSGEISGRGFGRIGAHLNGPDNGVCTSGRGLTTHLVLAERGSAHYV